MGGRGGDAGCAGGLYNHGFSEESLNEHHAKHGRTFGNISKVEYDEMARQFRDSLPSIDIEEFVAPNGSIYKYNKRTNEFMVHLESGEIITYFKPNNSYRYWMTQRKNYEE
jgi:pyocin large subunit-like protein